MSSGTSTGGCISSSSSSNNSRSSVGINSISNTTSKCITKRISTSTSTSLRYIDCNTHTHDSNRSNDNNNVNRAAKHISARARRPCIAWDTSHGWMPILTSCTIHVRVLSAHPEDCLRRAPSQRASDDNLHPSVAWRVESSGVAPCSSPVARRPSRAGACPLALGHGRAGAVRKARQVANVLGSERISWTLTVHLSCQRTSCQRDHVCGLVPAQLRTPTQSFSRPSSLRHASGVRVDDSWRGPQIVIQSAGVTPTLVDRFELHGSCDYKRARQYRTNDGGPSSIAHSIGFQLGVNTGGGGSIGFQ